MSMQTFRGAAVRGGTVLALTAAAQTLEAQSVIYSVTKPETALTFTSLADIDLDGVRDWLIAAPTGSEEIHLHSGVDGVLREVLRTTEPNSGFGTSIAIDDVNRDGKEDFIVGSPFSDVAGTDAGRVQVFSGADQSILLDWKGLAPGDRFGTSVAALHTANETHILVGSPDHSPSGALPKAGLLQVFDGTTGALLFQFAGVESSSQLGTCVAALGVTRFGRYVVSAPFEDGAGSSRGVVRFFRPSDGKLISTFEGPLDGDSAGEHLDNLGDLDQDLFHDLSVTLAASAPFSSRAQALSGATGTILFEAPADGPLLAVRAAGDVNGDGVPDLLSTNNASLPGGGFGQHQLFSGVDGRLLETISSDFGDKHAVATSGVGDLDGDGRLDFATARVGGGQTRIDLHRGADVFVNATPSAAFPGDTVLLTGRFAAPGSPAILFLTSFDSAPLFQRILGGTFDGSRAFDVVGPFPPGLTGHVFGVSLLVLDPVRGLILSDEEVLEGL